MKKILAFIIFLTSCSGIPVILAPRPALVTLSEKNERVTNDHMTFYSSIPSNCKKEKKSKTYLLHSEYQNFQSSFWWKIFQDKEFFPNNHGEDYLIEREVPKINRITVTALNCKKRDREVRCDEVGEVRAEYLPTKFGPLAQEQLERKLKIATFKAGGNVFDNVRPIGNPSWWDKSQEFKAMAKKCYRN